MFPLDLEENTEKCDFEKLITVLENLSEAQDYSSLHGTNSWTFPQPSNQSFVSGEIGTSLYDGLLTREMTL